MSSTWAVVTKLSKTGMSWLVWDSDRVVVVGVCSSVDVVVVGANNGGCIGRGEEEADSESDIGSYLAGE